jgi:tetratricopeptide (TPR) repeat protein
LYQQNVETLSNLLEFITEKAETSEDQKLIELANLKMDDLRLALGRKLVREQKYPEALAQFQACDPSIFNQEAFSEYFSAYPRQYIGSRDLEEDPLQPLEYFEKVATYQQETTENPDDAWAWYNLGLAAYNMSYWGEGWLFSDRMWGAMEIEYGDPTDEDYFTNDYAKVCFEKALAANPEPELGAQICYMGALCERNQYYIAYTNGRPDTYKQEELDYYRIKMETSVKPTFQSFFKRLKNQYDETEFESQVIKECITYVNYKLP